MPRRARSAPGGYVYHVLNRAVGRMKMFRHDKDYAAFVRVMELAVERHPIRILSYCLMPSHWHFVVWPETDGQVSAFFRWLAHTHAMRWRVAHHSVGDGHLYQGRFKSFPVQEDDHFLTLCRYVERNPLAAGLVKRAEAWPWSSLSSRSGAESKLKLSRWPVNRPANWPALVNAPLNDAEAAAIQTSLRRDRPLGSLKWIEQIARRLDLSHTLRREGRPKMEAE